MEKRTTCINEVRSSMWISSLECRCIRVIDVRVVSRLLGILLATDAIDPPGNPMNGVDPGIPGRNIEHEQHLSGTTSDICPNLWD